MCKLCEDIKPLIYVDNNTFKGWYPEENENQIVRDEDGNFHIWDNGGGDPFIAGVDEEFANINYCPRCGRKLKEG